MGYLFYDSRERPIEIDDRALAHLRLVLTTKLRRGESFTLSWRHPDDEPGGRTTIWLHPSIPLRFEVEEEPGELNRGWIERIATSANSSGGISLVPEDETGPLTLPTQAQERAGMSAQPPSAN